MLIAQFTDTHIVPKDQAWMGHHLTAVDKRLSHAITALNSLSPRPDAALFTGDTIDKGGRESYAYLKELLGPLAIPLYIIPGNHDDREEMRHAFSHTTYMPLSGLIHYSIEDYPIRLIGLDTLVPQHDYGQLSSHQLHWLETKLKENRTKPTLLFMHHFPITVGQKCFDTSPLQIKGDFETMVAIYPQVIGIVAGHYHKACFTSFGGKPCVIAPSVAPTHHLADSNHTHISGIDLGNPSFMLHRLIENKLVSECLQVIETGSRIYV